MFSSAFQKEFHLHDVSISISAVSEFIRWCYDVILYNGTNGSILLSIILHAFHNISISIFATALPNFPMIILVVLLLGYLYLYWTIIL
ncbi:MAG: hypothetical protein M5U17_17370 [Ignavibacterium sp.]|nr:hypothetical protein [Ignavibacterium sp.]